MIISKNRKKVKSKAISLINKSIPKISRPVKKFILEMCMGILMTGSCNVNLIAASLKERPKVKHTLKRLQRMLLNSGILLLANKLSLQEAISKINKSSIIALDMGDITHQYGEKFEKIATIKDGSTGKLRNGYWLNQISGYNPATKETFPIILDIFSTKESSYKSNNNESFKIADKLVDQIGNIGLWVMDRGYDGFVVLHYFLSKGFDFVMRMNDTRNIMNGDEVVNIKKCALGINRRYQFHSHARFGSRKIKIEVNKKEYEVTLICFKDDRNKEPMMLLTNGWIRSTKELKRRIRGYFHRWSVEDCYRFEKQGFGIEKSRTRNFKRIKNLIGLSIISWLILIKINEDAKLKEAVLKEARMEKSKKRLKFPYYRLLRGIQLMFAGIKRLFLFRMKKKEIQKWKNEIVTDTPLFKECHFKDDMWWEKAA